LVSFASFITSCSSLKVRTLRTGPKSSVSTIFNVCFGHEIIVGLKKKPLRFEGLFPPHKISAPSDLAKAISLSIFSI